ncbi:type VI secretion system Vgr family protein [Desulfatitalea tepidiphila]|uniref:type VI secretion system Vgr family protein n=1 Tax=Desulfatitalea tepidiphila TaxID=1185843 RepID=UPI0006B489D1|nr:type VI secretion system tip protein TssI/VgrG [Desulfatitalea tepidiphila]
MAGHTASNQSRFHFRAGGISFRVAAFKAREDLSELYRVELNLAVEEEIETDAALGHSGLLTIDSNDGDRFFHGVVYLCRHTGRSGRFHLYDALLMPQAALLDLRHDCRIFQDLDVPGIVAQVFEEAGITPEAYVFRLQEKYIRRNYCVQYRESDLHFIRRLLAEEGIFFFFEHGRDQHRMVFGDGTVCYPPLPDGEPISLNPGGGLSADRETILTIQHERRITSGRYTQRDFNFKKPALDLTTGDQCDRFARLERYDYPGIYALPENGRRLARVRLEQTVMTRRTIKGQGVVARFVPGFTFHLDSGDSAGDFLLQSIVHRGEQPQVLAERSDHGRGTRYINDFEALPADVPFRPAPMQKPTVPGVQTAIVSGPKDEEIYTDRYGRVKVRFHWDRRGRSGDRSSCWLRVSQSWAGTGWGSMFIPRIGQEVVVDFLEGDPDRPLITGRAFHGENPPPYDLPAHKSISTFKSLCTPGGGGFNEIRFEDRHAQEHIFVHAQRDMDLQVNNDRRTRVGANAHTRIEKDVIEAIAGDAHLTVHADSIQQVDGSVSQTVGRDRQERVAGHYGLASDRQIHIDAGTELLISAGKTLTLKAGAGFMTIDADGVSLVGPRIKLNSGGSPGTGRGCIVQAPRQPQEVIGALPGQTDGPPAAGRDSHGKASPDDVAMEPNRKNDCNLPDVENLSACFQHAKTLADSKIDLSAWLQTGYDIDGPTRMTKPGPLDSSFNAIWNRDVPTGEYGLRLNGFCLDAEAIKGSQGMETQDKCDDS